MAKQTWNEPIGRDVDWGGDSSTNGLPVSGAMVQRFIKESLNDKIGDSYFDPTTYTQYSFKSTEDKLAWLNGDTSVETKKCPFEFTDKIRQMSVVNYMDSKSLYYTQVSTEATITVGFKSEEKGLTETSWTEVLEDAYFTVAVDRGFTGKYTNIIDNQLVLSGDTLTFDVLKYLATGNNRVKVTVEGVDTGAVKSIVYTALLTTMYLAPSNFKWNVPFVEGSAYSLGGVNIGGNIDKMLKIKVSNEQTYSKLYEVNIGTQTYTGIAYFYDGLEFPTEGTGIYNVEMWLDANGLESEHLHYNIICVAQADMKTAQLIAISNVPALVKNYDTNNLFSYAIYSGGATIASPVLNVSAIINNTPTPIVVDEVLENVATGEINTYVMDLEVDTQEANIQLYASIALGDSKQEAIYAIDNSASFPAVAGALFYLNPANRNNAQPNKTAIVNESNLAAATHTYEGTWKNISFTDGMDGWTVDNYGRKCLRIPATCKVEVNYAPFANATTRTIELSYRVENTSNYAEDIISIASEITSNFVGARVKPTNVLLHSSLLKTDDLMQGYNTKDEELVHLMITIVQSYKRIGNLAQIYVNGVKKCSFEWSAGDTFAHNGTLAFGSDTADLYIYKMRVYTSAFEWPAVMQNFISCLPDTASKKAAHQKMLSVINDGYQIDFDKVKNGGFNYFVIRLPEGKSLPSILSQNSVSGTRLEINIQQNKDFVINGIYEDETTEGQGTTAMNYFRWNLRWKTEKIRVTAKKNFASSMHSHKMGGTALFNDLNLMLVGPNEANGRVAVEQYGAYGFFEVLLEGTTDQYTYIPIGLYTIGQDKGDKATFGYNNKEYKGTLIHLEGTDHSPKAVGMDYPWHKLSVATNTDGDANLGVVKKDGSVIAAWEIGACGSAESDPEMLDYLAEEFKPAYDMDYLNTSMLVALEAGTSIDDINANLAAFRAIETDLGYTNADCLVWIDGEYETYYYDVIEEKYLKDGVNILSDLGISESTLTGTTAFEKNIEIRRMRMARYRAKMENYWHLRDSLFHYCFIVLFAATDNFKKNTYPYKFGTLESGSRWRWRQDDLDTMFDINNQGLANKIYSLLNGDKSGTTHLFRGNTSYHWTNIQFYYENEIKDMMLEILNAMASLSDTGNSLIEKAVGCVRKYFWNKAQDYFTKSAYNIDAEWSYEEAWAAMKNGTYAAPVHPLQQSLGSHYEAEVAWVELRFLFMASLYGFGAFAVGNDSDTTLGQISFRPAQGDNTFRLTPAVNMNPTILVGDSDAKSEGRRLVAGETAEITIGTDGDTSIYIQGADYLSDIGDFSKIHLYAENPALTVQSKRLQNLKVGDENPENVETVLKTLNVLSCPSLSEVDARNVSTLAGTIDLSKCPRLVKALFGGSSAGEVVIPDGSKITEFELPDTITNLSLLNLPNLSNLVGEFLVTNYENNKYYHTNISVGDKFTFGNTADTSWVCCKMDCLGFKTLHITGIGGQTPRLWCFLNVNNTVLSVAAPSASVEDQEVPVPKDAVSVVLNFNKSSNANYSAIFDKGSPKGGLVFGDLTALTYLRLENNRSIRGYSLLKSIFEGGAPLTNIRVVGFDHVGDATDAALLASLSNGEYFGIDSDGTRNPKILPVLEGTMTLTTPIYEDDYEAIQKAYGAGLVINLSKGFYVRIEDKEVLRVLLSKITTDDGVGIKRSDIATVKDIGTWFTNNSTIVTFDEFKEFDKVTTLGSSNASYRWAFAGCTGLRSIVLPHSLDYIYNGNGGYGGVGAFYGCTALEHVGNIENLYYIGHYAFYGCTSLVFEELRLPKLETVGSVAFSGVRIKRWLDMGKVTSLSIAGANKTYIEEIVVPETVTTIGKDALNGCTSLTSLEIDWTKLISIDAAALAGCSALPTIQEVNLANLTTLGQNAFKGVKINRMVFGSITSLPAGQSNGSYENFGDKTTLKEISLPDTLTSIQNYALLGYNALEVLDIKWDKLTSLGTHALSVNPYLEFDELVLSSLTTYGQYAINGPMIKKITMPKVSSLQAGSSNGNPYSFGDKSVLEELVLSENLTSIPNYVFRYSSALRSVTGLGNIATIGSASFGQCPKLEHIDIDFTKVTTIAGDAFSGDTSLVIETLDTRNLSSLGTGAFGSVKIKKWVNMGALTTISLAGLDKNYLEEIMLPTAATIIPSGCFQSYPELRNINNGMFRGITTINANAVTDVPKWVQRVTFPDLTTIVSTSAGGQHMNFVRCGFTEFHAPNLNMSNVDIYQAGNGIFRACENLKILEVGGTKLPLGFARDCPVLENVLGLENVTQIRYQAFANTPSLAMDMVLPNCESILSSGASSLGGTFANCGILSLDAPKMTAIGSESYGADAGAFYSCPNLHTVKLRDIATIGQRAFSSCGALRNFIIDNITPPTLGSNAFANCGAFVIYVPSEAVDTYKAASGWSAFASRIYPIELYNAGGVENAIFFADSATEAIVLANYDNGDGYFMKSEAEEVTSLGRVFKGNTEVQTFDEFENFIGVTSLIGGWQNGAFYNCTGLSRITFPQSLTTLAEYVFQNCTSLNTVNGLERITSFGGEGTFNGCPLADITEINMPNLTGVIKKRLFSGMTHPHRIENLGSITDIANTAYSDNIFGSGATFLRLPSTIQSISSYAFRNLTKVEAFICEAVTPPTESNSFADTKAPIYVPDESVDLYKATSGWVNYADRIKPLSEYNG